MKNTKLKDILIFKEFSNYLSHDDLVELSMSCKYFRVKLAPFNEIFNFDSIIEHSEYNSQLTRECFKEYEKWAREFDRGKEENINDYVRSDHGSDYEGILEHTPFINPCKNLPEELELRKNLFTSDIKKLPYRVNQLNLHNTKSCFYLLYEIPSVFYNMKVLSIQYTNIPFELFQYLLDNLVYLEDLELSDIKFLYKYQDYKRYYINWPLSLKKLKTGKNFVRYVNTKGRPILLSAEDEISLEYDLVNDFDIDLDSFQITPKQLPNLVSYDFKLLSYCNGGKGIMDFLKLNTQIKKLKIRSNHFDIEIFEVINTFDNLIHLELPTFQFLDNPYIFTELPVFYSIKHLELCFLFDDRPIFHNISNQFPNVTNLTLKSEYMLFCNLYTFNTLFPKLTTLKLCSRFRFSDSIEFNFPILLNLESLELIPNEFVNFEEIEEWNFNSCPNLRLIRFTRADDFDDFIKPILNPIMVNSWSYVYFPSKISFYKNIE